MKTIIACALTALIVGAGGATAASLITSARIKNGTIRNADIHKGTISLNRLNKAAQRLIRAHGKAGPQGPAGAVGPMGPGGSNGSQGPAGKSNIFAVSTLSTDINAAAPAWAALADTDGGSTAPPTPQIVPGGAQLGPFSDGSQLAAVVYNGANGLSLRQIAGLTYTASYEQSGTDQEAGQPYLRIFTEDGGGNSHRVIFTPTSQPVSDMASGRAQKFDVVSATVRYDDDAQNGPDITWNQLIDAHGSDTITSIRIQAGDAGNLQDNMTALVQSVTTELDGQHARRFDFGT